MAGEYNPTSIRKLSPAEAMRRRPTMYIGHTDQRGLHSLIYEIVNNSVAEAIAGYADHIDVVLRPDGAVLVHDNGRGIPVETDPDEQKSILELVMSAWYEYRDLVTSTYKLWIIPLNAVVVNALSEWARVEVRRDGQAYRQEYRQGLPTGPVAVVGADAEGRGTTTIFKPDPMIFETTEYDYDTLAGRFRELCYLTRGLEITFVDQRIDQTCEDTFYFEQGIRTWMQHLNRDSTILHQPFYVEHTIKQTIIEVALQYNNTFTERILGFANNVETVDGGMHLTGFYAVLTYTLNAYARKNDILKKTEANLTGQDVRAGLTAIVGIKLPKLHFVSCTRNRLGNPEVCGQVQRVVGPALRQFLVENPAEAQAIIEHCLAAARARVARKGRRRSKG